MPIDLSPEFQLLADRLREWLTKGVPCVGPQGTPCLDDEGNLILRPILPRESKDIQVMIETILSNQMPQSGNASMQALLIAVQNGVALPGGPSLVKSLPSPEEYVETTAAHGV